MMKLPAIGRKNWLFVGSETGGHRAAILLSIVASAKHSCRQLRRRTVVLADRGSQRTPAPPRQPARPTPRP